MSNKDKVEVLRFDFGGQDYIVENNAAGWASFYESFGVPSKVTVTIETWGRKKLEALPEWGN